MLQDQGIEVQGVHFSTGFCMVDHRRALGRPADVDSPERIRNQALKVGGDHHIPIEIVDVADEFLREVVLNPKHGYGSAFNPCIDCRIFMLRKAAEIAEKEDIPVLFTGEVLGQRPKSQQRPTLELIEIKTGLKGKLLRPLSAKHMPSTEAERDGLVDRDRLGEAHGRSRREQFALAERFGVEEYPTPGGGCCYLADHNFARRMRDLVSHHDPETLKHQDIIRLKIGRHFRLSFDTKVVFGRDEAESTFLAREVKDGVVGVNAADGKGAYGIVEGNPDEARLMTVAAMAARYSRHRREPLVKVAIITSSDRRIVEVEPISESDLAEWRL
jgi:tRNA U34 2-thiouridine synthase MnmA/TrmU